MRFTLKWYLQKPLHTYTSYLLLLSVLHFNICSVIDSGWTELQTLLEIRLRARLNNDISQIPERIQPYASLKRHLSCTPFIIVPNVSSWIHGVSSEEAHSLDLWRQQGFEQLSLVHPTYICRFYCVFYF